MSKYFGKAKYQKSTTADEAIDRNILAVHDLRIKSDENRRLDQKFIDRVAALAGSTSSLYVHILFYGSWALIDSATHTSLRLNIGSRLNLGTVASLESIFLAVFVLINQRRMNAISRRHSDLHLQMSLLTEHEITKIAQMTDAIAKKVGVESEVRKDFDTVKNDVHPQEIVDRLSELEARSPTALTSDADLTHQT